MSSTVTVTETQPNPCNALYAIGAKYGSEWNDPKSMKIIHWMANPQEYGKTKEELCAALREILCHMENPVIVAGQTWERAHLLEYKAFASGNGVVQPAGDGVIVPYTVGEQAVKTHEFAKAMIEWLNAVDPQPKVIVPFFVESQLTAARKERYSEMVRLQTTIKTCKAIQAQVAPLQKRITTLETQATKTNLATIEAIRSQAIAHREATEAKAQAIKETVDGQVKQLAKRADDLEEETIETKQKNIELDHKAQHLEAQCNHLQNRVTELEDNMCFFCKLFD